MPDGFCPTRVLYVLQEERLALANRIQNAGTEVVEAKAGAVRKISCLFYHLSVRLRHDITQLSLRLNGPIRRVVTAGFAVQDVYGLLHE